MQKFKYVLSIIYLAAFVITAIWTIVWHFMPESWVLTIPHYVGIAATCFCLVVFFKGSTLAFRSVLLLMLMLGTLGFLNTVPYTIDTYFGSDSATFMHFNPAYFFPMFLYALIYNRELQDIFKWIYKKMPGA